MKKHLPFWGKALLFAGLVLCILTLLNKIFLPTYTNNNSVWPTTTTVQEFYELPEDSIDVLFLGSSHAASAFSPQELYNSYGLTSYNLSTEQQSMLTSYYWLEEALRTQSPSVVVFDTLFLFDYTDTTLNCDDSALRKAFDYMEWSPVKIAAINDICTLDESQSIASYYLPLLAFHSRWTELESGDFVTSATNETSLKGFVALGNSNTYSYEPITIDETAYDVQAHALMLTYLDKITALCKEQGIELVLTKTLTTSWTATKHNIVQDYADEHDLIFIDFNESTKFEQLSLNFTTDYADSGHANISGATKLTGAIGAQITEAFALSAHQDAYWDESADYYAQLTYTLLMPYISTLSDYLYLIDTDTQVVFVVAKQETICNLPVTVSQSLSTLGITLNATYQLDASYFAIITGDSVIESFVIDQANFYTGTLSDYQSVYSIQTGGSSFGDIVSICINDVEYTVAQDALNLVVYDAITNRVIDAVSLNVYDPELLLTR